MPPTPRPPIVPCWLTVRYHRVEVEINDQVATTRVDQVFANETGRDLEGTYVFPLPESATVTGFSMWVDGQRQDGEVLTREEARRLYESIVRRNRDPALLEYVGRGAFQARVFPVPAGGERRLQLEYTQALTTEGDVLRYVYPLNTERFSARPLQQAAVSVTLRSARPLKAIYSPSHEVSVVRQGEHEAQVSWEAANVRPREDFELVFGVSPDPVGLHLLTHRPAGEDGYFLLLAAPAVRGPERPVAQDVTLVFDTSGSMAGAKMEQARGAMRYVLNRLRPEDRFNVVTFSSTVSPFAPEMQPAGSGERERALALVERLEATGGTNINEALTTALGLAPKASAGGVTGGRPHTLIFVTDGLPTVGPRDAEPIISAARAAAGPGAAVRVFPFGVGHDVNTTLLDALAAEFGGVSAYVKPGENLEEAVSAFYARVGTPVLTDLRLDFGGAGVYDLLPPRLPDLYAGGQILVAGRYRTPGTFDVSLSGVAQGSPQRFALPGATFAGGPQAGRESLPRLWAGRKIGFLLGELRRRGGAGGGDRELIDEVVALSRRYGIATPYTSIFVPEPGQPGQPGQPGTPGSPRRPRARRRTPCRGSSRPRLSPARRRCSRARRPTACSSRMPSRGPRKSGCAWPGDGPSCSRARCGWRPRLRACLRPSGCSSRSARRPTSPSWTPTRRWGVTWRWGRGWSSGWVRCGTK